MALQFRQWPFFVKRKLIEHVWLPAMKWADASAVATNSITQLMRDNSQLRAERRMWRELAMRNGDLLKMLHSDNDSIDVPSALAQLKQEKQALIEQMKVRDALIDELRAGNATAIRQQISSELGRYIAAQSSTSSSMTTCESTTPQAKNAADKPHKCVVCHKSYVREANLKKHKCV